MCAIAHTRWRNNYYNIVEGSSIMGIRKTALLRIKDLCKERKITLNTLANLSGVTPSTVYSLFRSERSDMGITTLKKLCDGLEISIIDFFNDDIFENIEQELE